MTDYEKLQYVLACIDHYVEEYREHKKDPTLCLLGMSDTIDGMLREN